MQLNFQDIQEHTTAAGTFMAQRAKLDRRNAPAFWSNWRNPDISRKLKKYLNVRREPDGWYIYRLYPLDTSTPGTFARPYTLRDRSLLYPYQVRPAELLCASLLAHNAAIDSSDTGIGKTYQALAACRDLKLRPYVICRKAGIPGWKRAIDYMRVPPLAVTNWEALKGKKKIPWLTHKISGTFHSYQWRLPKDGILIFDEAHMASNMGTINNEMYISSRGTPSIALSATFADRISRLEPFFYVLGIMDHEQFCEWMRSHGVFENIREDMESLDEREELKRANRILIPEYGARVSSEDPEVKKHFPDGIYNVEIIDIGKKAVDRHNRMYTKLLELVDDYMQKASQAEKLVAGMRYRQAAEMLKVPALAELTKDHVQQGNSVCIFVNYRESLFRLAELLKTNSVILGDQEHCKDPRFRVSREEVINAFQSDQTRVIICMADAGGISINLHDTIGNHRRVSLICPNYNPVSVKQVLGRTRRAGSRSTPVMKLVYSAGTVEEQVAYSVNSKLDNIAALNDGDLMEPDLFKLGYREGT